MDDGQSAVRDQKEDVMVDAKCRNLYVNYVHIYYTKDTVLRENDFSPFYRRFRMIQDTKGHLMQS